MLNQYYIIIDHLPEKELEKLKENLKDSTVWKRIDLQAENLQDKSRELEQYPADNSILLSTDCKLLECMKNSQIARMGFLEKGQMIFGVDMVLEGLDEVDERFLDHVYQRKHQLPWTILETRRCIVREITLEDIDDLFDLYAEPDMTKYMEPLYEREKEIEYQKAYITNMYGFYGYGMWLVFEKKSGKMIGRAGLEHREELGGELELGYAIGVPYQRQGYATEVCEAILEYAKEELAYEEVNCLIEQGNEVSEHLAKKLGFALKGSLNINGKEMKHYVIKGGLL